MTSQLTLDFRIDVTSNKDKHRAQAMNDLLGSFPNPVEFSCLGDNPAYSSELKVRARDNIGLMEFKLDSPANGKTRFTSERTHTHIARNQSYEYNLLLWQGGDAEMLTAGQRHIVRAGDFTIMGNDTPFLVQPKGRVHAYNFALPAAWERIGDTRMENTFGRLFSARERSNKNITSYAKRIFSQHNVLSAPNAANKLYDVVALALNQRATSEHRAGLLALIVNFIGDNLADTELKPAKVASAFGISVRYLHQLFADDNVSFTEHLLSIRLEKAHLLLTDPHYRQRTILGIAYDCGFRDINHFGRRFKTRYGFTPGELRRSALVDN